MEEIRKEFEEKFCWRHKYPTPDGEVEFVVLKNYLYFNDVWSWFESKLKETELKIHQEYFHIFQQTLGMEDLMEYSATKMDNLED